MEGAVLGNRSAQPESLVVKELKRTLRACRRNHREIERLERRYPPLCHRGRPRFAAARNRDEEICALAERDIALAGRELELMVILHPEWAVDE
jgi:hypothetical protein